MEQNTIKIFLASSNELHDERVAFGNFIRRLDAICKARGMRVEVFEWEDYDSFIIGRRTQDEYNEKVRESDMFVVMFYTRVGNFTIEEFNVAMDEYRKKGSPKVYVYCRNLNEGDVETPELKAFKGRLNEEGNERFWVNYSNQDSLQLHFVQHLLMVENGLNNLKLEGDKVMLEGLYVAELANLSFAASNKDYNQMKEEIEMLPDEIEKARKRAEKYPDDKDLRDELQRKLNRYNALKDEFALLQKALFETSQRIAGMQREQLSDKLRRAAEAFEKGNLDGANALLREMAIDANAVYHNMNANRALVHQYIEGFLLRAKTLMLEVNTPIVERIKQVQVIYAKADQWAKKSTLPDEKYEGLLRDYSSFLYDYGLYKEAEPILLRLISLCEKLYGKDHADTATSYNNIGLVYDEQGNYAKALEYYSKALDIRERVLGPDHPSTAGSYNNIGTVYRSQGDYAKALEYYRRALDIRERVLDPDHPDTASSYNNIGGVYDDQGDYPKALEYLGKALDICKWALGPDHPSTATSYNNIGEVYRSQGDYAKALEYLGKALDIRERVLGPDHPSTATSYNNIGLVYYNIGDYPKALEYLGKALDIRERVLGPDHPSTATSYNNIGRVYYHQGNYTKALEYCEKALDICERVLGPDHPSTAGSYNNIGMVYDNQGDYAKALEYYGKALDICERVLSPDHPSTATSYNNIGMVYDNQGDYAKALEYYGKALNIRERVLGSDHPDTAASYNNIAGVYYSQGDYAKALEYYGKALDRYEQVLGKDHPKTKTVKENIVLCLWNLRG